MKNTTKIRAILSSLLIITFIIVLFTGIGLYFSPTTEITKETAWTFLGFNRTQLEKIHTLSGFAMSALVIFHLLVNYTMLKTEIKISIQKLFKKN